VHVGGIELSRQFGLVGGPLIILSGTLVMFGVFDQGGAGQGLATIPEFIWELGLGIYATVWGFKSSPILAREAAALGPASVLLNKVGLSTVEDRP
jgi:peptidoglycan/LPS O-acetylase OafA/YrhL